MPNALKNLYLSDGGHQSVEALATASSEVFSIVGNSIRHRQISADIYARIEFDCGQSLA
jgi:hypothetical protein